METGKENNNTECDEKIYLKAVQIALIIYLHLRCGFHG